MLCNKIKITELHTIDVNIDGTKGNIIVPLYNNIYIPIFFNQKDIFKIVHCDDLPFTHISNNFEMMDFSNGCILECSFNGSHYKHFLKKNIFKNKMVNRLFMKNYNMAVMDLYNNSDVHILFYIRDKYYFELTTKSTCSILYRTYFLIYKKKFHIINEAYRIIYD